MRASFPQSDGAQICTPKGDFVRIVPPYGVLRDFVVHSTRAAWVDGRGSASGDRYTSVAGPGEGAVAVPLLRCQRRLVTEFLLTIIVGTYVIIPVVWPEPYVDC